jgi:hypothetical protein
LEERFHLTRKIQSAQQAAPPRSDNSITRPAQHDARTGDSVPARNIKNCT